MQDKIPVPLWFPSTFCATPSEKHPTPEESDFLDFYQQQAIACYVKGSPQAVWSQGIKF